MNKQEMKLDKRMNEIFDSYKMALSVLMKQGRSDEAITLLRDGGIVGKGGKTFTEIVKSSKEAFTPEEIYINRVNFVLTFLNQDEKRFIIKEYLYNTSKLWYQDECSRSTYYRNKRNVMIKFLRFFDCSL